MSESSAPFPATYSLLFGVIFTLIGAVETFVTPDPGSWFGPAMLLFGPSMLLLWWSGKTGAAVRKTATVTGGLAVGIGLYDNLNDLLGL